MQFNLFSLFVLTTAAALACAIARLPIDPMARVFPIAAIVICYIGWAVRNYKYPDPRQQPRFSPPSRSRRVLQLCLHTPLYVLMLYSNYPLSSNNSWPRQFPFQLLWYAMLICFAGLFVFQLWYALKPDPKPLTTQLT